MSTFIIEGGHQLKGKIQPQGAKNEALQILCAVLLTDQEVRIDNIPDIVDVNKLIALLKKLGVKVDHIGKGSYTFKADEVDLDYLESEAFKKDGSGLRGSIMIVGPLLSRFGRGYIPKPGGDKNEFSTFKFSLFSFLHPYITQLKIKRVSHLKVKSDVLCRPLRVFLPQNIVSLVRLSSLATPLQ